MAKATPHAVLSASRSGETLALGLFPLRPVADDLTVASDGKDIFREHLVLKPEQCWKKDVALSGLPAGAPLTIKLGAKLVYETAGGAADLGRPLHFSTPSGGSAEALFLQGRGLE
jgi:hypothetical protein